jgi:glycosyltransferase involved in cell wall biosynthesis
MLTIADLCPYWTWPTTGGGPVRVYNLNRVVAHQAQLLQFSARPTFGHQQSGWQKWVGSRQYQITPQYREYQYFHPLILGSGYFLYRRGLHSDLFLSSLLRLLSPRSLRQVMEPATIIQVEHPWLFDLAQRLARGRPIVYVAHNVEAALWEKPAPKQSSLLSRWVTRPRELEKRAVQQASAIIAMSAADAKAIVNEYSADPARIVIIPNGVDTNHRQPATPAQKTAARARLGLDNRPVLLFTGSDHYPNKEALRHIQRWQTQLGPELGVQFVVVGGVGRNVSGTASLRVAGFVEDMSDYLAAADIALNPLTSGSGTSLKAVEYLACGLPTITTATGMRGLELKPNQDVLLGDITEFPQLIAHLLTNQELQTNLAWHGRQTVAQKYSWEQLGQRMLEVYARVSP